MEELNLENAATLKEAKKKSLKTSWAAMLLT